MCTSTCLVAYLILMFIGFVCCIVFPAVVVAIMGLFSLSLSLSFPLLSSVPSSLRFHSTHIHNNNNCSEKMFHPSPNAKIHMHDVMRDAVHAELNKHIHKNGERERERGKRVCNKYAGK